MSYSRYTPSLNRTNENGYMWYECNCCPYGYHIDLDFVRYCESISQEADNRTGSIKRRKDRRRQRQSMEVLLGLTPPIIAALEDYQDQDSLEIIQKQVAPKNGIFSSDSFDDAVTDFERTLKRSKNKLSNNLPDVTAVSASGPSMAILPTARDGPSRHEFDTVSIELGGLSPLALQNIREQMALSLERTKHLEDQVKLIPELTEQLTFLRDENKRLTVQLKTEETRRLNSLNGNYIQPQYNRQRSHSFTHLDGLDNMVKREKRLYPPKKDFGVMCGVLTRNIGVGNQIPNTKNASTITLENDLSDKWLQEKVAFLNKQNLLHTYSKDAITITKGTQTLFLKEQRDVGMQFGFEQFAIPKISSVTQTVDTTKSVNNIGVLAKPRLSNVSIQKYVECYSVGCSDDTVNDIICEKCNAFKRSVGVGPETNEDTHTSPVSLSLLSSRSKSFNLGDDRLNFTTRTRTVASQYEPNGVNIACQADIKTKTSTKSCQYTTKLSEKSTQYQNNSVSKVTDTLDLVIPKRHIACEAKERRVNTVEVGCNTTGYSVCASCKCDKENDEVRDSFKKDGGSPTPSRIPRLQLATSSMENRVFKRQDTYTKIYSSPNEKSSPHSPTFRFSNLELSPIPTSSEKVPVSKVKQNPALPPQNEVSLVPITKVHVQEITLPSRSTVLQPVSRGRNRKKAIPSKEMQGAMKVLNDSLQKSSTRNPKTPNAIDIVQQEWFKISSLVTANPLDVEDYLDGFEDISNLLLHYIVNMSDTSGNTAMHYAVSHGNFDVVSILLDSKVCDINKTNKAGYTSVMLVSLAEVRSQTHANVVRRLFQLADVNIRAKQHGQTALMLAVSHGRLDMVKLLLEAGADMNIQDEDGSTALMCAAEHGHIEIIKLFLSHPDCDSSIMDVDGSTALKIAMEAGHRHIGVLLYAHERNLQKAHSNKLKKTKSMSPKAPSSPLLPIRNSHRALTDTKTQNKNC